MNKTINSFKLLARRKIKIAGFTSVEKINEYLKSLTDFKFYDLERGLEDFEKREYTEEVFMLVAALNGWSGRGFLQIYDYYFKLPTEGHYRLNFFSYLINTQFEKRGDNLTAYDVVTDYNFQFHSTSNLNIRIYKI